MSCDVRYDCVMYTCCTTDKVSVDKSNIVPHYPSSAVITQHRPFSRNFQLFLSYFNFRLVRKIKNKIMKKTRAICRNPDAADVITTYIDIKYATI